MNMYVTESNTNKYKNAVEENAKGKFYKGEMNNISSNMVNEIKNTKTTALNKTTKTSVTDHPQIFLVLVILLFIILIIIEKRIML